MYSLIRVPCSYTGKKPFRFRTQKQLKCLRVRLHGGKDANMPFSTVTSEPVEKKEKLIMATKEIKSQEIGWIYGSGYDYTHKRRVVISETMSVLGLIGAAISLVFLSGSLFIFLLSFLVSISY